MDLGAAWQALLDHVHLLTGRLVNDVLVPVNLVQIPALALTGGMAWLICQPIRRWLTRWVEQVPVKHHSDWIVQARPWIISRLVPLITPAFWVTGLWAAVTLAGQVHWPHDTIDVAISLLLAWLVIRLATELMPYAALGRFIAIIAWSVAALNIVHLLGPTLALLDSAAVVIGGLRISILTVLRGALSLAILLWVTTALSNLFDRRMARLSEVTPRARVLLGKLTKASLIALAFVITLTSIGVDLSTFALFTGALGVGVGLGLQRTASNLFSGIVLLLDRSIKPGDVIEVGGTYGWVSSLGARYVSVETRDGTEFLIPNEDIITHQVLNWSHKSERVRLKLAVRVPLTADLDRVLPMLRAAADQVPRVLKTPAPNPLIMAFGESALELELRFWIEDAQNGVHNVKSEVLYQVWRQFRDEGIEIPYPKHDLYVRANARIRAVEPVHSDTEDPHQIEDPRALNDGRATPPPRDPAPLRGSPRPPGRAARAL